MISVEISLTMPNGGTETSFCLKVVLSNTLFSACKVLMGQYDLFLDAKYQELQPYVTDCENEQFFLSTIRDEGVAVDGNSYFLFPSFFFSFLLLITCRD